MVKQLKINKPLAETVAVKCLHFVASDPDILGGFLAATGLGPDNLRAAAQDPNFLSAILTFISEDEARLLACAQAANINPQDITQAYEILVGHVGYEEL